MRWSKYLIPAGFLFAVACGKEEATFQEALPSKDALTVNAPDSSNALAVGQLSGFYVITRLATVGVNVTVAGIFNLLEDIVRQPPTTIEGETAIWGPGAGDALDPNVYRLVVTGANGKFTYSLEYRRKNSEGDFIVLASGHSDKSSGEADGVGDLSIFVTAWGEASLNPCDRGTAVINYDTTTQPQKLSIDFSDFRSCEEAEDGVYSASYYYDRFADGSGNFQFTANGDIQEGARAVDVLEDLVIRSRWNATGAGRSDAKISGGDLSLEGVTEVTTSECWDANFGITFAVTTPQVVDLDHTAGAESACPAGMQSASYSVDASIL
ncbi:MAG: hypothetical protein ACAI38_22335 [Myxococcota bacterium]|nr:hypothetical protein [Myxococcota bacterium]